MSSSVEFNPTVTVYRQIGYAKHQLKKEQFRTTRGRREIGRRNRQRLYVVQ